MATRRPKRPPRRLQMDGPNGENTTFGERAVQTGKHMGLDRGRSKREKIDTEV